MKKKGPNNMVAVALRNQKVAVVDQKMLTALTKMILKMMTTLKMMTDPKKLTLELSHPKRVQIHWDVPAKKLLAVRMKKPKSIPRMIP